MTPDPETHALLTPAEVQILLTLVEGDRHGYAIMREVRANTGDELRLGPGTLYAALKRLLSKGLILEAGEHPDPALGSERRRYYTLSAAGRSALVAELERLERTIALARRHRLLPAIAPELAEGEA